MHEQILTPLADVWRHHRAALHTALAQTIDELNNLLRLDEYHRHGHEADNLQASVGPLGAHQLDLGRLSAVLGTGARARAMPAARLGRVQALRTSLQALSAKCEDPAVSPPVVKLSEPAAEITAQATAHFERMAQVFRALRVAQLEIRSKYDPAVHDAEFATFGWRQLGPAELRLCPPFLVTAELSGDPGDLLRQIMVLLESRLPLKIAVLRTELHRAPGAAGDPGVPAALAVEMLPLALRGVYFLQSCVAAEDLPAQLAAALTSPRPGVISVLGRKAGENREALVERARRAVRSRAFALCTYDPDRSRHFVSCFDLTANPEPGELWQVDRYETSDADGQPIEVDEAYTFAHYAAGEPEFATEFSPPAAAADNLVRLVDYLEFNRSQRVGKVPFITVAGPDGGPQRLAVSTAVARQSADRLHLWRTLREIAGVENPHVQTTRFELKKELGERREAELVALREQLEAEAGQREQRAVARAVQTLVARCTGVPEAEIGLVAAAPPAARE